MFGFCQKITCKAFKKEVIFNDGDDGIINKKFNLEENAENIRCPICNEIFVPKTCGFWDCEYQFIGDKMENGKIEHVDTKCKETKDNDFDYFDSLENSNKIWMNLTIFTISKQKIKFK